MEMASIFTYCNDVWIGWGGGGVALVKSDWGTCKGNTWISQFVIWSEPSSEGIKANGALSDCESVISD